MSADKTSRKRTLDTFTRLGGNKILPDAEKARQHFARTARDDVARIVKSHKAWIVTLAREDVLETDNACRILEALASVDFDHMVETYDVRFDKPILQVERYLVEQVGEHGSDVVAGRTLPPPLYRMKLREAILPLIDATHELREALLARAGEHAETVMPGYTHSSHAQPMTYGHYLLGVHDAIARASRQVEAAYAATNRSDMGCGALAGTSFAVDRLLLADLLGFDGIIEHSNDCVAATDFVIDLAAAVTNLFIPISRAANEMGMWTMFEMDMLDIADSIAATSSLMPQKKNATICEHLRFGLASVIGLYSEIATGAHSAPYGDTMDVMFIWRRAPAIAEKGAWGCRRMKTLVESLTPRPETMLRLAREGFSTAPELAAVLFREKGLAWRTAHAIVASVVRRLIEEGKTASDITPAVLDEISVAVTGETVGLPAGVLQSAIDPRAFVEAHASRGGVAPQEVRRMLEERNRELNGDRKRQQRRRQHLAEADARLDAAVAALTGKEQAENEGDDSNG